MPSLETVDRFIAMVEQHQTVEAMERFYAPHASMQENEHAPRVGRETLVTHERAMLAQVRSLKAKCLRPALINGDHVVIRWLFETEALDGKQNRLDEVALQRWQDEQIVEEKFFYDPRQLQPRG